MNMGNTEQQWGWPSKLLHWLTALLILIQIPLGIYADDLANSPLKLELCGWHKSVGILILMLAIMRLLWRLAGSIPNLPDASLLQRRLANLGHSLLYGLMLVLPLSGWLMSSAANRPINWFWLVELPALTGPNKALKEIAEEVHEVSVILLLVVLGVHIGAALWHHFKLRDSVLKRMWF
jgi:cytochrome b561